jgi:hypothetical protein
VGSRNDSGQRETDDAGMKKRLFLTGLFLALLLLAGLGLVLRGGR